MQETHHGVASTTTAAGEALRLWVPPRDTTVPDARAVDRARAERLDAVVRAVVAATEARLAEALAPVMVKLDLVERRINRLMRLVGVRMPQPVRRPDAH